MDEYQTISDNFRQLTELVSASTDTVAEPLQKAAKACTEALTKEHKLLCCGDSRGAAVAQMFTTALLHRLEQERPGLPAICLSGDGATLAAIAGGTGSGDIYARQVRALGQTGDILMGVAVSEDCDSVVQAIHTARERAMTCVILSGGTGVSGLLQSQDIEINIPGDSVSRIIEMQTAVAHCLCQLIDQAMFGGHGP